MAHTVVEQEKNYNILKDAAGDIMILIRARMEDVEQPKIVYNGAEHALLYRNSHSAIVLDYIHPNVREQLERTSSVLIVETRDNSVIREYNVPMTFLKEIPLPSSLERIPS